MASDLGDSYAFNAHGDVLNASPSDPEEISRLVDELKSRGNAAFKSNQLPTADTLYSKAIEHDANNHAIYGNRSMTRLSMGKFDEALEDADSAIAVNEAWPKGHFRRAKALCALDRYSEALGAIRRGVELDPKDKTLVKEEAAIALKAEKAAAEAIEEAAIKAAQPVEAKKPAPAAPVSAKRVAPKKAEKAESAEGAEAEDDEMKGYKILADGRKTSFFHHEMTVEEKALLGDMTPKQLTAEEAACLKAQQANKGAGSVWAGNTWEDRKMNDWAESKLKELLAPCTATVGEDTIAVDSVDDFDGSASIYVKHGKKKHFYDLSFKIKWEVSSLDARGSLEYADVVQDDVEDSDVVPNLKCRAGDCAAVRTLTKALQADVLRCLEEFTTEFLTV